jgi:DNA-binding transcriptional LysR family regulator
LAFLENVETFVRVVDLGGMAAAARQLRLSPAVVTYRLQQLEQHLEVRLLNRTTRTVQLTEAGRAFYEAALGILRSVETAQSVALDAGGVPAGSIRLSAPLGLGRHIGTNLLPRFCAKHTRLSVRLQLSDHLLDLYKEAVDLSVRLAVMADSSLIVSKIADCPRVLCAAPSYLKASGTPLVVDDLFQHECLLLRYPGSQQYRWTLATASGPRTLHLGGRFDADDGELLTVWALQGLGIVMKPVFEVAEHLNSGALRPLLLDHRPQDATLAVVYPHREFLPSRARLLAEFLSRELAALVTAADVDLTRLAASS